MQKEALLEQIGLTKNEVKVYFGLLDLGICTTTPLVKKVQISISKIYPTLDKLIMKGLVSYIVKNNIKHFQATDPSRILEIVETKEKDLNQQKKFIKELIPQLQLRKKLEQDKQEATIYEGYSGVQTIYHDLLSSMKKGEEYYVINLGEQDRYEEYKKFYKNYHSRRDKKGVKVKIVTHISQKEITKHVFKGLKHCSLRFTHEPLPSSMVIYKNKVVILLLGEKETGIVVESKQNAEQIKNFFISLWERAK